MLQASFEEWLKGLKPGIREDTSRIVDICVKYFKDKEYFFRSCGFYVVGSSLVRKDFNDIDLVLVGLDFRQVFDYLEGCDEDMLEAHGEIIQLGKLIEKEFPKYRFDDLRDSPFKYMGRYAINGGLVSSIELFKDIGTDDVTKEDGRGREKPTYHIIFHGQNLLVSSWKRIQEKAGAPYLPIIEFYDPENDTIENRPSVCEFIIPVYDIDDDSRCPILLEGKKDSCEECEICREDDIFNLFPSYVDPKGLKEICL